MSVRALTDGIITLTTAAERMTAAAGGLEVGLDKLAGSASAAAIPPLQIAKASDEAKASLSALVGEVELYGQAWDHVMAKGPQIEDYLATLWEQFQSGYVSLENVNGSLITLQAQLDRSANLAHGPAADSFRALSAAVQALMQKIAGSGNIGPTQTQREADAGV